MPQDIKNIINDTSMPSKKKDGMIWFSCEGENPADRENIGPIKYYPDPGVPTYFYPYKNQDGYHSPAVFAHFEEPKRKPILTNQNESFHSHVEHFKYQKPLNGSATSSGPFLQAM